MRRRRRRAGQRPLVLLALVAIVAAVGANGTAQAQSSDAGGATAFGGFKLDAHGEGMTITYASPGLIPGTPPQLFAGSLPEASSNMDNGPSGYAFASLLYPGPLIADLGSVLVLGGVPQASAIPGYPLRAQAFYPAGPTDQSEDVGSGRETVDTTETSATAVADYGAAQLPAVLNIGAITSSTDTHVEDTQVVSRSRVELSGVDLLAGLVHIDSIVTDIVSVSTGTDSATDGTTTVGNVTFLGLPATLDADGLHFASPPQAGATTTTTAATTTAPANPLTSVVGQLPTGGLGPQLQPIADALNGLLVSAVGNANADANQLLSAAGVELRTLDPVEVKSGADASRYASGLFLGLTYDGKTEPVLSSLLNLIPVTSLPSQGVGPIPFSSPQSLFLALQATHVVTLGLGAASVHAAASPPFSLPSTSTPTAGGATGSTGGSTAASGSRGSGSTGFSTPTPGVGSGGGGAGGSGTIASALPIGVGSAPLAGAVAVAVLLLLGSMCWFGSGKLADNVLSVAGSHCPEGLDS